MFVNGVKSLRTLKPSLPELRAQLLLRGYVNSSSFNYVRLSQRTDER